ncbi:MAG: class I SAM-dependent methyltransferase [Magnetococcus sp. THC-1_WYH]
MDERRFYFKERYGQIFHGSSDTIPVESYFVQDNPLYFKCLLELESSATPGRHYTNLALNTFLSHYCPKEANVLDVGCGSAGFLDRFERIGISGHYHGVDIRTQRGWHGLENRLRFKMKATFSEMPAEQMVFDQQFDFSVSSHSLEHQEFPQETLKRVYSAMKPGSFGLFFLPAPWALFLYGFHGWRNFQPKQIDALFSGSGFKIERLVGLGGMPSFLLHVLFVSWLETGKIFEILTAGRLHWRLRLIAEKLRIRAIRKDRFSIYKSLSRVLLPLDKVLPRPHHAYCVVFRRPK